MSIYGEGLYRSPAGEIVAGASRAHADVQAGRWEVRGPEGEDLIPMPTPEAKPPALESVYALSKYHQEKLCLIAGRAYGIPTLALRFFNVYGPRQALSNPYTGVLAIFAARLLNEQPAMIFEDGQQKRDFVSVHDVARHFAFAPANSRCRHSGTPVRRRRPAPPRTPAFSDRKSPAHAGRAIPIRRPPRIRPSRATVQWKFFSACSRKSRPRSGPVKQTSQPTTGSVFAADASAPARLVAPGLEAGQAARQIAGGQYRRSSNSVQTRFGLKPRAR